MDSLISQLGAVQITTATDIGLRAIRLSDHNGVRYAIDHGGHLEVMLTEAIRCNRTNIVDLLLCNNATVFPSDVELARGISPDMYYRVAFRKHATLADMFGGMKIAC